MRKGFVIALLVISFAAGMLSYNSVPSASGKLRLSKKNVMLTQGKSYKVKLKGAKNRKIVWKSSNKNIATVQGGLIRAKKSGRCSVIAEYEGKKYKCNVQVKNNKPLVTPKPTSDSPGTSPSASPESSWGTNGEADIKDAKLVIDNFAQDTKVITFSIYNTSESMITLPTYIIIEKYNGKDWIPVPRKANDVTADAMYIMPDDKCVMETSLDDAFEGLDKGRYRLCVPTSCGKVFSEFEIV